MCAHHCLLLLLIGFPFKNVICSDLSKKNMTAAEKAKPLEMNTMITKTGSRFKRQAGSSSNLNTTRNAICTGFMNNDAGYWTYDYAVPASCYSKYFYVLSYYHNLASIKHGILLF
jgi:hypothetical protein